MQKPDTRYAYFHVRGSFDPDDVTRRVGVTPTETKREGDAIGTTSKKRPCSLWALYSRVDPYAPLDEHVRDVLDQLDSNKSGFEKLSRELGGTMQLVGYSVTSIPAFTSISNPCGEAQTTAFALTVTSTTVEKSPYHSSSADRGDFECNGLGFDNCSATQ
jgi:hypothetical protein